jgi:hypothetical protein
MLDTTSNLFKLIHVSGLVVIATVVDAQIVKERLERAVIPQADASESPD